MTQQDLCPYVVFSASIITSENLKFNIDSTTGSIQVVEKLNYEYFTGYDVVIETVDQSGGGTPTNVFVGIVDENEAPVLFHLGIIISLKMRLLTYQSIL